jgi:hypothetical protein
MITNELIEFIKSQLNNNISRDLIISQLLQVGWKQEDIEEGFLNIEAPLSSVASTQIKENINIEPLGTETKKEEDKVDPYREIPLIVDPSSDKAYEDKTPVISTIDKIAPMKVWTPINIEPKIVEIKKEEKAIEFSPSNKIEPFNIEIADNNNQTNANFQPVFETPKSDQENSDFLPNINKNPVMNIPVQPIVEPFQKITPTAQPIYKNTTTDVVHKNAMISSYSQDILAASKEVATPTVNRNKILKIGIIITILIIIGGMAFAFVEGYIKFPGSKFSFSIVKRDPKIIIINAPSTISKLKSYKVDTNISISAPSLSNITTGLSSGEAVASKDRDSISINTKGLVNHQNSKLNLDYSFNLESSILENGINSNLKYDGNDLYATIPDLSDIIGNNAPKATIISLKPNQFNLLVSEFSSEIQNKIKELDIYNIFSGEVPLYVKNETHLIFKEFINGLEYTEKANEKIRGVDTYHYEMVPNRQSTKKFLTSLMNLYIVKITPEQKKDFDETLGSSYFSSFEVWIGKNDDNLYQVKFTLNTPLSKILGLNDSGIAGNEVKLDFVITYFDLDVQNDILFPKAELGIEEFVKKIKDIKIKNIISSFKAQTISFKNAVGSFGTRSNPSGSCINPNPSSIFSPKGHKKGADSAVSSISSSMNDLLSLTNGTVSCYSTSNAWALEAPLFVTPDTTQNFYCADSTGNVITLTSLISGPVCK